MDVPGLVRVVMEEIRITARSDAAIGTPLQSGDSTVFPVSRVSCGFGAGGGGGDLDKASSGSGVGGGVKIEPVAFMVLTKGKARLLPVKNRDTGFGRFIGMIPKVMETIRSMMNRKKGMNQSENSPRMGK